MRFLGDAVIRCLYVQDAVALEYPIHFIERLLDILNMLQNGIAENEIKAVIGVG
jgi:hypothetical protein